MELNLKNQKFNLKISNPSILWGAAEVKNSQIIDSNCEYDSF